MKREQRELAIIGVLLLLVVVTYFRPHLAYVIRVGCRDNPTQPKNAPPPSRQRNDRVCTETGHYEVHFGDRD